MIYNYTKCESVIAKIMADLDISEKNIRITDIREWIFEAVDKIGAPMQYITKESGVDGEPLLKIEDYQAPLPYGLQHLDAVAYANSANGRWVPVRKETSSFKNLNDLNLKTRVFNNHYDIPCVHEHKHEERFIEHSPKCKADIYTKNGVKYYENMVGPHFGNDVTYFIKPGWIVTNMKTGFLKLSYKTIATDERGYPLIPDLSSYQEAVYWYVVMKLNFPKYLKGQLGGKGVNTAQNTYFFLQQQWNFYRNQAYAECMMPSAGDMESIKNEWNKLLPEFDSSDTFFKHEGDRQIILNDYYHGY